MHDFFDGTPYRSVLLEKPIFLKSFLDSEILSFSHRLIPLPNKVSDEDSLQKILHPIHLHRKINKYIYSLFIRLQKNLSPFIRKGAVLLAIFTLIQPVSVLALGIWGLGQASGSTPVASFNDDVLVAPVIIATATETPELYGTDAIDPTTTDSLVGILSPEGTVADVVENSEEDQKTVDDQTYYTVRQGDTLASIAELFEITAQTIRLANNMSAGSSLKVGANIIIPPGNGLMHTIQKGDTIKSIAKKYKPKDADIEEFQSSIEDFNYILDTSKLVTGQKIFIPDGVAPVAAKPKNTSSKGGVKGKSGVVLKFNGSFAKPINGIITSGYGTRWGRPHEGIDFGVPVGTPVYAAASGTVQARPGYNGGYGNLIVLKHSAGVETRYAHLSRISVSTGEHVNQGDLIGYSGNTGHSTGPHLHFEIRQNGKSTNPAAYL